MRPPADLVIDVSATMNGAALTPGAFPKAIPLGDDLPPVPAFDSDLLPDALRPWLADAAERLQAPLDFLAVPAMVSAGAAIGRRCAVRPKRWDDWCVVPNIWGAIVGRPSTMKSPAIATALAPARALEAEAARANADANADYERAMKAHAAAEKVMADAAKAAAKAAKGGGAVDLAAFFDGQPPEAPRQTRIITNDSTYQKAGELMADNPNGILVVRDELVSFLRPLDREEHAAARGFWLEAWNGDGAYTFDRIQRGTVRLQAVCAGIIGGVQPARLAQYVGDAVNGGAGDDGLLQRFGLIVWPDADPEWRDVDRYPDTAAKTRAHATFKRLAALDADAIGARRDEWEPTPSLALDEGAAVIFAAWRESLERETRSGALHPALESHLIKYRKTIPALALISHLVDNPLGGPITETAMARAVAWAEYLRPHAERVYAAATMPERSAARLIWNRLKAGAIEQPFTARDIQRRNWTGLGKADAVAAALEVLDAHSLIVGEMTSDTGGRPTTRWRINPQAVSA